MQSTEDRSTPVLETVYFINDVETLRVVADRTRLEMLDFLRAAPHTVKEVAAELEVPPTKLYYHVRLLEEHGLIRVVDTRVVSGIIEKSYQSRAYRFSVARALLPGAHLGEPALDVALSLILDEAAGEIRRSLAHGLIDLSLDGPGFLLGRSWLRMTPAQADLYEERMLAIHKEIASQAEQAPESDLRTYEILVGIYPTLHAPDVEHQNDHSPAAVQSGDDTHTP